MQQVQWTVTDPATGDTTLCEAGYRNGVLVYSGSSGGGTGDCSRPPGPAAPSGPAAPVVTMTPEQVAQMAVARLVMPVPEIGTAPAAEFGAVVGLPVWLWTPAAQWEPQTATAAVPGISVTATATLRHVTWDMGDGQQVTCTVPGKVWTPALNGANGSPDCGYTYSTQGAKTVTATALYDITWTGAVSGSTVMDRSSSIDLAVREIQVVNL